MPQLLNRIQSLWVGVWLLACNTLFMSAVLSVNSPSCLNPNCRVNPLLRPHVLNAYVKLLSSVSFRKILNAFCNFSRQYACRLGLHECHANITPLLQLSLPATLSS